MDTSVMYITLAGALANKSLVCSYRLNQWTRASRSSPERYVAAKHICLHQFLTFLGQAIITVIRNRLRKDRTLLHFASSLNTIN